MVCGTSSFHSVDEHPSSPSTPKGSKKKHGGSTGTGGGNSKNPYSSRGLEKFTSVLSELEAKKEKIMARRVSDGGGGDVPMVRFKYSNAREWIPIVVRLREDGGGNSSSPASPKSKPGSPGSPVVKEEAKAAGKAALPEKKLRKHVTWSEGEGRRRLNALGE